MSFLEIPVSLVKSYINTGHARSINAKKNIIRSFLIRGGSIAVNLLLLPFTIHYVNPTQYGIWLTLSSIISWLGFFDIGFGNGLRNKLTEAFAKGQHKLARIYVSTTYAILTIIISLVLVLFFCINPFLNWSKMLNAPPGMAAELSILALIVFVFFCLQFVFQLLTTIIVSDQQPSKASLINFIANLLSLTVIFILTKTTAGNLIYLGICLSMMPVVVLIASSLWCYTHEYKRYAPSYKFVRFRFARGLMTLGLKFFIIQIAFIVIFQTDNIVISQLFGPKEVTPYNVAYKYFGIIPMVLGIIMLPFWSAFTEAWIKKDFNWIKQTMKRLKFFWLLLSIVTVIMLVFSNFIFGVWVGKEVIVPISLAAIMAAYVTVNAWNAIYSQFLNGIGKIKLQLYSGILGMILNIPLAILFGKAIGVGGVILASVVLGTINMIWTVIQYNKIINNKASGIWDK